MKTYMQSSEEDICERIDIIDEVANSGGYDKLEAANKDIIFLLQHLNNILDSINDNRDLGEWFIHPITLKALEDNLTE